MTITVKQEEPMTFGEMRDIQIALERRMRPSKIAIEWDCLDSIWHAVESFWIASDQTY